jgi:hypothetical protein
MTHDVTIFLSDGAHQPSVNPDTVVAAGGDFIMFRAVNADFRVILPFPYNSLFGNNVPSSNDSSKLMLIIYKGTSAGIEIKKETPGGVYPYVVLLGKEDSSSGGGLDPTIIIH